MFIHVKRLVIGLIAIALIALAVGVVIGSIIGIMIYASGHPFQFECIASGVVLIVSSYVCGTFYLDEDDN